jgi:CRISPR/Cas system-associated exonuclease Cas4 (RecB family)
MATLSPTPRVTPYTYATWLTKAIAGERQCLYAGWFKSHFKVQGKRDANLDAWTAEHTAMVHDVAAEYRAAKYEVFLEGQNTLRVRGHGGAVLVGKPDIVAVKCDTAVIVDCKTGRPRTSDSLQVRLYMYLLSEWSTHPARGCQRILGEVRYKPDRGDTLHLPHAAADGVADLMKRYLRVFLSPAPPMATPSFQECRFCELAGGVCIDSVEEEPGAVIETTLF